MNGIGLLLSALGIEINPDEVKQAVESAKILIPKIAQSFDEMNERLKRIEIRMERIELRTYEIPISSCEASAKHEQQELPLNGKL